MLLTLNRIRQGEGLAKSHAHTGRRIFHNDSKASSSSRSVSSDTKEDVEMPNAKKGRQDT